MPLSLLPLAYTSSDLGSQALGGGPGPLGAEKGQDSSFHHPSFSTVVLLINITIPGLFSSFRAVPPSGASKSRFYRTPGLPSRFTRLYAVRRGARLVSLAYTLTKSAVKLSDGVFAVSDAPFAPPTRIYALGRGLSGGAWAARRLER